MARTESNMIELGTKAPEFTLLDPNDGKFLTLTSQKSDKATLIMFICNHCPFVIHIANELSSFANEYKDKGLSIIAINSNDITNYPDDSPEKMITFSEKYKFEFPYLFDETQNVAKEYGATCTPDFFLYDGDLKLRYRGQFDDSRPGNGIPVTGKDIKAAFESMLINKLPNSVQKPSVGCGIKWK